MPRDRKPRAPSVFDDLEKLRIPLEELDDASDRKVSPRFTRLSELFSPVLLSHLIDPAWHDFYPSTVRLYHYLWIRSGGGKQLVRLTSEMAGEIGLSRWNKSKALRELETLGLVTVARAGQKVPTVRVIKGGSPGGSGKPSATIVTFPKKRP